MDDAKTRTAFLGLLGGFVLYAFSLVALYVLPEPWAFYVSTALLLLALAFGVVWVLAVRGGWRLGRPSTRSSKRRKEREKDVKPWARR